MSEGIFNKQVAYEVRRKSTGKVLFSSDNYEEAQEFKKARKSVELVAVLNIWRNAA